MPTGSDDREVAPPLIPIVIGVTGKRELGGSEREDHVRESLLKELGGLEKRFPNSPLVLITGLAKGAGLLAADAALKQPTKRWTVVGLLPRARELFLEDFREEDQWWRDKFEEVTRPGERFLLKELKPPLDAHEQVDLVIADRCSLLIAVMPKAEEDDRSSGTARIVRYKRDGEIDSVVRKIAEASEEIAPPEPLDGPMTGVVWILDPDPKRPPQKEEERYARITLEQIEAFNQSVRVPPGTDQLPIALKLFEATTAGEYIARLRKQLGAIQGKAKSHLSGLLWVLALLFIASVATLETFTKIFPKQHWLYVVYGVLAALGLGVVYRVSTRRLQAFAEDYRGASEAMRVQVEWWRLGLRGPKHRADRYYLVGGEGHFAVLRRGIKAVTDAALLLDRKPASQGQPLDLDLAKKGSWIPSQIDFFQRRSDSRHRTAIRWSSLAWYLFQLSVGVGVAIGAMLLLHHLGTYGTAFLSWLARKTLEQPWLPIAPIAVAFLWAVVFWIFVRRPQQAPLPNSVNRWQRVAHSFRHRSILGTRGLHSRKRGWPLAVLIGLPMVPAMFAYNLGHEMPADEAFELAEKVSIVLMIVLAAASGAVRFVLERSALEAEAVSYREALQRFNLAHEHALEARKKAGSGAGANVAILQVDQELGRELGRVALAENEAWLRAHRQRPFETIP